MTSERKMIISYAKWCTDEDDTRMEHEHVSVYKLSKAFLSEVERNEKLEGDNKAIREALEKITHEKTQGTQSKTTGLWCGIVSTEGADLARTTLEGLRVK